MPIQVSSVSATSLNDTADILLKCSLVELWFDLEESSQESLKNILPNSSCTGTLFVKRQELVWLDEANGQQVSIPFIDIGLHAISRSDQIVGDRPCIYMQIMGKSIVNETGLPIASLGQSEDEQDLELRIVPQSTQSGLVDDVFASICEASSQIQEQDSDQPFNGIDNMDTSGWITSENVDSFIPNQDQLDRLQRLEGLLEKSLSDAVNENGKRKPDGQFEDAPEPNR